MDRVITYLTEQLKKHTFFSCPPSSALILWWPSDSPEQHKTFVTRRSGEAPHPLEGLLLKTLHAPLVIYSYDEERDLLQFELQGKTLRGSWDDDTLARELAKELGLPYQAGGTRKAANDPKQVKDHFHVWSREAFAGIKKTDIDLLLLDDNNRIRALVEVKRSSRRKVGEWTPYEADPYDGLVHFARAWNAIFFTIHHEITRDNEGKFSPEIPVDVFTYNPTSSFNFTRFASEGNRQVTTLDEFLHVLLDLVV